MCQSTSRFRSTHSLSKTFLFIPHSYVEIHLPRTLAMLSKKYTSEFDRSIMGRVLLAKDLENELNAFSDEIESAVQVFQVCSSSSKSRPCLH